MFCYQCEQTAGGKGCLKAGVCGKDHQTAVLQDLLLHATKGMSTYAFRNRSLGIKNRDADVFVIEALFTTVTNVNFNAKRIQDLLYKAVSLREQLKDIYENACTKAGITPNNPGNVASWQPADTFEGLIEQGNALVEERNKAIQTLGEDIVTLRDLILFGLKGMAAYADHAKILKIEDDEVYGFFHEALDFLSKDTHTIDELLQMALKVGEINVKVMALLDQANTSAYGHPVPTKVRISPVKGKAILVSGHDLKDLEELLKQTEGKNINIYTHGEMLPTHGYPELKKYPHLAGNYGGAWQDQQKEFDAFPGAILMTTNCLQRPRDTYKHRIFTTGLVGWPEVRHIANKDFTPVIEAALAEEGFPETEEEKYIMVGFGHNAVLGVADKVIEAVKNGDIKHFFLIGGCDGAKSGRNYYTQFAEMVPKDCIILTLACGKYRFNKLDFGDINGIPRLLDIGQCNDSYSAVMIAKALADAFGTDINSLPLSLVLSWYEQKAVTILLSLLYLGIQKIRLGPSLPAFVSPSVFKVLQEKFNIMPITTPEKDLKAILG
jgi:hydroxylamine reductase